MAEPQEAWIIDDYKSSNLNKAAYLMTRGARYVSVEVLENGLGMWYLENVNTRHVKEFWKDDMVVEFWTFIRQRAYLKQQLTDLKEVEANRID